MKHLLPASFMLAVIVFSSCTKSATNSCKGTAIPDCICTLQYDPVCGCDGNTYGNSCEAKCAGIKSWTAGKCQ